MRLIVDWEYSIRIIVILLNKEQGAPHLRAELDFPTLVYQAEDDLIYVSLGDQVVENQQP